MQVSSTTSIEKAALLASAMLIMIACGDEDALSRGDASNDSESCIKPCPHDQRCGAALIADQDGLAETLQDWRAHCEDGGSAFARVVAGTCGGGSHFLALSFGRGTQSRYFDADGGFIAMRHDADYSSGPCGPTTYWPFVYECTQQTDVTVYCSP